MALSELEPLTPEELEELSRLAKELGDCKDDWETCYNKVLPYVERMIAEIREYEQLFALQHRRTLEADRLWQVAHNQPDIFPDLGELIGWLLEQAKTGTQP